MQMAEMEVVWLWTSERETITATMDERRCQWGEVQLLTRVGEWRKVGAWVSIALCSNKFEFQEKNPFFICHFFLMGKPPAPFHSRPDLSVSKTRSVNPISRVLARNDWVSKRNAEFRRNVEGRCM